MRSLVYSKAIVWKPEGMEQGNTLTKPQAATPLNPLVLLMRRARDGHRHTKGDIDLPGGGANEGESTLDALLRELSEETNIQATDIVGNPQLVFANAVVQPWAHDDGKREMVNVVHNLYAVQVRSNVDVDPSRLTALGAEHDARAWLQLVRAVGAVSIESYQNGLAWVFQNRLLVPAAP